MLPMNSAYFLGVYAFAVVSDVGLVRVVSFAGLVGLWA